MRVCCKWKPAMTSSSSSDLPRRRLPVPGMLGRGRQRRRSYKAAFLAFLSNSRSARRGSSDHDAWVQLSLTASLDGLGGWPWLAGVCTYISVHGGQAAQVGTTGCLVRGNRGNMKRRAAYADGKVHACASDYFSDRVSLCTYIHALQVCSLALALGPWLPDTVPVSAAPFLLSGFRISGPGHTHAG